MMNLDVDLKKTRLILFEDSLVLLLCLRGAKIKVDVLRSWSSPEILTVPSATGNTKCSLSNGVNTSFALSLRAWNSDASIPSNSSMSRTIMSLFPDSSPRFMHNREKNWQGFCSKLVKARLIIRRYKVILYHHSKWNNRAIQGYAEQPLRLCLPIGQKILNVSQIAPTFHGNRPPIFIQT